MVQHVSFFFPFDDEGTDEIMKTDNGEEVLKSEGSEHPRAQGTADSSSAEAEEKERKR